MESPSFPFVQTQNIVVLLAAKKHIELATILGTGRDAFVVVKSSIAEERISVSAQGRTKTACGGN